jgi:hypothetical protein
LPGYVWLTAVQVAYFKKIPVDQVLKANRDNVTELYKIPQWSPTRNPLVPVDPQAIKDKYYFEHGRAFFLNEKNENQTEKEVEDPNISLICTWGGCFPVTRQQKNTM